MRAIYPKDRRDLWQIAHSNCRCRHQLFSTYTSSCVVRRRVFHPLWKATNISWLNESATAVGLSNGQHQLNFPSCGAQTGKLISRYFRLTQRKLFTEAKRGLCCDVGDLATRPIAKSGARLCLHSPLPIGSRNCNPFSDGSVHIKTTSHINRAYWWDLLLNIEHSLNGASKQVVPAF